MTESPLNNPKHQPDELELREAVGDSFDLIKSTVEKLRSEFSDLIGVWKYYKSTGWHQVYETKGKRMFYLIPHQDNFRFSVILGDKAITKIRSGAFPDYIIEIIDSAKKYPEGTPCMLNKENYDVDTVIKLLKIKMGK